VLDLVVGEYLFYKFPRSDEGELSKLRASLVNAEGFTKLAKELDLGKYLFISPAEDQNSGREKPSILSNAFEALMGAIYLESDLHTVERIAIELIEQTYPVIDLRSVFKDYKTTLQELTQAEFGVTPEYNVIDATGPDHQRTFEVEVSIHGKSYARAKGKSKKNAQQEAAKLALKAIKE
jgi:ribonuclease-3